jgi:hypothetical protein
MIKMADKTDKGIYYKTFEEAREAGEFDVWKESRDLNIDCANAIESAIYVHNYEMYRYNDKAAADDVVAQFGPERVNAVVAANIRDTSYDGRWSEKNKEWAKEIPALPHKTQYLMAHAIVLDGFAEVLRTPVSLKETRGAYEEELFKTEIKSVVVFSDCEGVAYAEHENAKNMPFGTTCAYPYSTWSVKAQLSEQMYEGEHLYSSGRYFESEEKAREDFAARVEELRGRPDMREYVYEGRQRIETKEDMGKENTSIAGDGIMLPEEDGGDVHEDYDLYRSVIFGDGHGIALGCSGNDSERCVVWEFEKVGGRREYGACRAFLGERSAMEEFKAKIAKYSAEHSGQIAASKQTEKEAGQTDGRGRNPTKKKDAWER